MDHLCIKPIKDFCFKEKVVFIQNMTIRFLSVASQDYKMDVHPEYVMLGNDVLLKCSFPSFVADFVVLLSWIDSEASEYSLATNRKGNSAPKPSRSDLFR